MKLRLWNIASDCQWLQLAVCNLAEIDNEMRETNDVEKNFRRWASEIWV